MESLSKQPSFKETGLASPITEFALAVLSRRGDTFFPSGTATIIAPYLAITARHVIEDFFLRYEGEIPKQPDSTGTFSLQAHQVLREGREAALWNITRLWYNNDTDIAYLRLTPASKSAREHTWRALTMNALPPAPGSRIAAFGYHTSVVTTSQDKNQVVLQWKDEPTTTIGEVIEVHDVKRDKVNLPFPYFRTNARFDGGMSGGPVFNDSGQLCGIICSNMPPFAEEDGHVSYVSSLWASMHTVIDMDRQGHPSGESYPVLELAAEGFITLVNWERLSFVRDEGGSIKQIALRVPSR